MLRGMIVGIAALMPGLAQAEEYVLRVHQPVSAQTNVIANEIRPWAAELEKASGGRLKFEIYDAMALGGKPADLYDQAVDGVVDIALTLPGYMPGRFPRTEVFELPFMVSDSVAASGALMQMIDEDFSKTEYAGVRVLAAWVHGPGVLHTSTPVATLEDLAGLEIRTPTRLAGQMLGLLGAVPVGMPLPAVPENLAKSVIDGAMIGWDVVPVIRLAELVRNHLEFGEGEMIYTATLIMVMNPDSYAALPADLQALIDETTGVAFSRQIGATQLGGDAPVREATIVAGNAVTVIDPAEKTRWVAAAAPVRETWIADLAGQGIDGAALIARATELMAAASQ